MPYSQHVQKLFQYIRSQFSCHIRSPKKPLIHPFVFIIFDLITRHVYIFSTIVIKNCVFIPSILGSQCATFRIYRWLRKYYCDCVSKVSFWVFKIIFLYGFCRNSDEQYITVHSEVVQTICMIPYFNTAIIFVTTVVQPVWFADESMKYFWRCA